VQRPVTMGRLAVEHLVAQVQGQDKDIKDIDTGVTVVTKDNMGSYTK
jgi:ribose transport system substrate-binding protein